MTFENLPGLPRGGSGEGAIAQLIYRSVSTRAASSALEMSDILAEARQRNADLGISGVLTVVDGQFLQVIEGPTTSIDLLIGLLERDPRHTALQVMERRVVAERAFGDWEMISPRLARKEAAQLSQLLQTGSTELALYIPLLEAAIRRQDAVLEGVESPGEPQEPVGPAPREVQGSDSEA